MECGHKTIWIPEAASRGSKGKGKLREFALEQVFVFDIYGILRHLSNV
jgi:hypothetical protein